MLKDIEYLMLRTKEIYYYTTNKELNNTCIRR
jgi:hypothetical protein